MKNRRFWTPVFGHPFLRWPERTDRHTHGSQACIRYFKVITMLNLSANNRDILFTIFKKKAAVRVISSVFHFIEGVMIPDAVLGRIETIYLGYR